MNGCGLDVRVGVFYTVGVWRTCVCIKKSVLYTSPFSSVCVCVCVCVHVGGATGW